MKGLDEVGTIRGGCGAELHGAGMHGSFGAKGAPQDDRSKGKLSERELREAERRARLARSWGWMAGVKQGCWLMGAKERGEWAELVFMVRCAGLGLGVMRPFGDSRRYDVAVETGERIVRVQVRSTIYKRRGREYSLNLMGPGRKRYRPGSVDYFAVYLIPENQWYIIPYEALGKKVTVHFTPGGKRQKYGEYLEAWGLLGAGVV